MTTPRPRLLTTIGLIGVLLGASGASARERRHHHHRHTAPHHGAREVDATGVRAVGRVAPIVAGSDKVKVDRAGQVITDRPP